MRVVDDLIRVDTSNFEGGNAKGEREAAEYVGAYLQAFGLEFENCEPILRRKKVTARVPWRDRSKPALVVHGRLDVVPAIVEDWSVDPFVGAVKDSTLRGHGAVDMKNMDAVFLTAVAEILRAGEQPERDLILTLFAEEDNVGVERSALVVRARSEYLAGATEVISEVGGYSITVADRRAYLLQVGEITGRATEDPDVLAAVAGPAEAFLRSSFRTTAKPTALTARYKHNVIPERAKALIDVRVIPGTDDEVLDELRRLVGDDIAIEAVVGDVGMETPFEGALVDAMLASPGRHDPGVPVTPYLLGAVTDNKALAFLGITRIRICAVPPARRPGLHGHVPRSR